MGRKSTPFSSPSDHFGSLKSNTYKRKKTMVVKPSHISKLEFQKRNEVRRMFKQLSNKVVGSKMAE